MRMLMEVIRRTLARLTGKRGDSPIDRGEKHKRLRWYFFLPRCDRPRRIIVRLATLLLIAVFLYSAGSLLSYGKDYVSAGQASQELRAAYHAEKEQEQRSSPTPVITPETTPDPSANPRFMTPLASADASAPPAPTAVTVTRLSAVSYPNNPYNITSTRFQKIRQQNQDIVGWITIDELLDEAVVQRDNAYYLTRDYRGYHNVNGAIFMDESISLRTRPYTYMLYGHNMKTGLMFGGLRNYENPTYYHNDPFVTFDTLYEDGRYVIFAVGNVSTDVSSWRYVNWGWLISSSVVLREKAIDSLFMLSIYNRGIDVRADDQLLMLITCVDEAEDRRVVAARRIREDESEEELKKKVQKIRKR